MAASLFLQSATDLAAPAASAPAAPAVPAASASVAANSKLSPAAGAGAAAAEPAGSDGGAISSLWGAITSAASRSPAASSAAPSPAQPLPATTADGDEAPASATTASAASANGDASASADESAGSSWSYADLAVAAAAAAKDKVSAVAGAAADSVSTYAAEKTAALGEWGTAALANALRPPSPDMIAALREGGFSLSASGDLWETAGGLVRGGYKKSLWISDMEAMFHVRIDPTGEALRQEKAAAAAAAASAAAPACQAPGGAVSGAGATAVPALDVPALPAGPVVYLRVVAPSLSVDYTLPIEMNGRVAVPGLSFSPGGMLGSMLAAVGTYATVSLTMPEGDAAGGSGDVTLDVGLTFGARGLGYEAFVPEVPFPIYAYRGPLAGMADHAVAAASSATAKASTAVSGLLQSEPGAADGAQGGAGGALTGMAAGATAAVQAAVDAAADPAFQAAAANVVNRAVAVATDAAVKKAAELAAANEGLVEWALAALAPGAMSPRLLAALQEGGFSPNADGDLWENGRGMLRGGYKKPVWICGVAAMFHMYATYEVSPEPAASDAVVEVGGMKSSLLSLLGVSDSPAKMEPAAARAEEPQPASAASVVINLKVYLPVLDVSYSATVKPGLQVRLPLEAVTFKPDGTLGLLLSDISTFATVSLGLNADSAEGVSVDLGIIFGATTTFGTTSLGPDPPLRVCSLYTGSLRGVADATMDAAAATADVVAGAAGSAVAGAAMRLISTAFDV